MRRRLPTIVAALAVGLPQEAPAGAPDALAFGWPEAGVVRVGESILEKGQRSETSYVLRWEPARDDVGGRILSLTDFSFRSFAGFTPGDPIFQDMVGVATVLGAAVPRMRISDEGYLVEFLDYDEVVLDLVSSFAEFIEPEDWQEVRPVLESPETYARTEQEYAEIWNVWVANWIGLEAQPGSRQVWAYDLDETGGVVPRIEVEIGETTELRGVPCVEIRTTAAADEERLLRATLARLGLLEPDAGPELPPGSPFQRMSRVQRTHGFYGRDDLRPLEVETSIELRAWRPDVVEPLLDVEQHRYVFGWPDLAEAGPAREAEREED